MAALPATFMVAVTVSYILQAPEGFRLVAGVSSIIGLVAAVACMALFIVRVYLPAKGALTDTPLEVVKH